MISFRSSVTLTLSIGCLLLVVIWPGWFTVFRAEGSYTPTTNFTDVAVTGDVAASTAAVQNTNIGIRLATLRGGGTGSGGTGGGASADASRQAVFGRLGLFLNGLGSFGDQDKTSRQPGFDFHTTGLTLGADYKLTDNLILGTAFGYLNTQAEINASAGHVATNGYSLSAFGTYYIANTMHVDAITTYGWNAYDIERNIQGINETARAHPAGNQFAISVGSGYDFNFGPLTAGPILRVNYLDAHVNGYQERGAATSDLKVNSQNPESVTTDLGAQVSYAISVPWGVLSPMARFEWEHEYKNDSRLITSRFVTNPGTVLVAPTNDPDRDYFNLGAGLTATFKRGTTAFFYYEAVLGRDNYTNHSFTAGVRFEFD